MKTVESFTCPEEVDQPVLIQELEVADILESVDICARKDSVAVLPHPASRQVEGGHVNCFARETPHTVEKTHAWSPGSWRYVTPSQM